MTERARKRTIVWVSANTFIRLPLEPVLTFPPAGTKVLGDEKFLLKTTEPVDPNATYVEVRLDL